MKNITFGFVLSLMLTTLMFGMSLSLFAQSEEPPTVIKKEIKIKKIIDEDGNETTETIETEVEVNASEWEEMQGEFDIDIDETIENGVKKRIIRVQADGENGELPQELQDELESLGIDINIIEDSEKRTIIIDSDEEGANTDDHDIRIFKMGSDEEMPEDIRKMLEEQGIDLEQMKKGGQGIRMYKTQNGFGENGGINDFFPKENTNIIDRETKVFRITNIDELDNEIINEIAEMGVSESELRERFDAAENSVRIFKEGLQAVEVEVDAPTAQQQMFFIGEDEEVLEIDPDMDFEWIEKQVESEVERSIERVSDDKPYLGITMGNIGNGVIILRVSKDSPAEKAGLKENDIITTLNGVKIENTEALIEEIQKMKVGDALQIAYTREREMYTTNATLAKKETPHFKHIQRMEMPSMPHMPRIPRIATERGHLGVNLDQDATILKVTPESPAADAGLEAGDRILQIGNIKVETADGVIKAMKTALPGTNTDVTFQRDNAQQTVTVVPTMPPHRERRMKHRNTCSPDDKTRWIKRMEADCEKRCSTPFLGIYMEEKDRDYDDYDVKITGIVQNTGAEAAGILEGDVLLKVNRASISNVQDVVDEISKYEPGDKVKVQVLRGGKKKRIKATLSNQTQAEIFSPCDCATGAINADAMMMREIILIKENAADIPQTDIDIKNTLNLDDIDLFPNPNNGTFTVRFTTESKVPTTISVIDVNGKEAYREVIQNFNGRYDNRIDISNQAKGTYFLNIIQGDTVYTEQLIFGKE